MADFIIKLLDEAKTQPLATVIVLVLLGVGIWWLIWERPKYRKDQQSLTEHVACSNELTRITHAVIENNSRVIANNTQTMEMTKQSLNNLTDKFDAHDEHAIDVLNKQTEILAIVRK